MDNEIFINKHVGSLCEHAFNWLFLMVYCHRNSHQDLQLAIQPLNHLNLLNFNYCCQRLATLLERVNCLFFKVNFQKIFLFFLWALLCSKVGDNGDFVFLSSTAMDRVLNPVQIGSVLAKICEKVMATNNTLIFNTLFHSSRFTVRFAQCLFSN